MCLRDSYAFCTEPVFASVANVLGRIDNMPELVPGHIADFQLLEVELKHGLCQVRFVNGIVAFLVEFSGPFFHFSF